MERIAWRVSQTQSVAGVDVPVADGLTTEDDTGLGIRRQSAATLQLKSLLWPLKKAHDDYLVDGFIEWELGRLIRSYVSPHDTVLEIGCGDMSLRNFLPADMIYNALEIQISEFQIKRVMGREPRVNLVIASATDIPAPTDSVTAVLSSEVFTSIPDIATVLSEIRRVMKTGGHLICSISNETCTKYDAKGPNPFTSHKWTFDEFSALVAQYGFQFIEGSRKGWWVPMPTWLTKTSYQLPLTPKQERDTTNFFYVFRAI